MDGRSANARAMEGLGGYNPGSDPRGLDELRRQQAAFARVVREEDLRNSWLAAPVLAAEAGLLGLGGAGLLAGRMVAAPFASPLNLERMFDAPIRAAVRPASNPRLGLDPTGSIRKAGRERFEQAYGIRPSRLGQEAEVHHSRPVEYAKRFPKADPNNLSNLWALPQAVHQMASREWAAFSRSLQGRTPSQQEVMAVKRRIDEMVAPYLLRKGIPRPVKLPPPGGGQ